jgi:hypothetical protein
MPQIEQAYSPLHTRLPSRFVITAFRQTFLSGMLKDYLDSGGTKVEKIKSASFRVPS